MVSAMTMSQTQYLKWDYKKINIRHCKKQLELQIEAEHEHQVEKDLIVKQFFTITFQNQALKFFNMVVTVMVTGYAEWLKL